MPISFVCPGCNKRLKAKDSLAGRTAPCPSCGTPVFIGSADDVAAALLRDDAPPELAESEAPVPRPDDAPAEYTGEPPARRGAARTAGRKPARSAPLQSPPALTANEPPLLLRHLHWLLVLSLIPLAASLLQKTDEQDVLGRIADTIEQSPEDSRQRIVAALQDENGSKEKLFEAMPNHKLAGAWLAYDTRMHWLLTAGAALLFFLFLLALTLEKSARPHHLLFVGLFTATAGLLLLFCLQAVAEWTQGLIIIPRGIVGLLFLIVQLIGFSYRAANDPNSNFFLSLMGFTLGVGLCEEICKALPLIVRYSRPNEQTWRGAYLWGLASGAAFGLAESVIYAGEFYNGVSGAGIYFVRNISCVALHAIWTGSAAIMIHRKQHWFQEEKRWYDWIVRSIAVVAVPMVLHGLYDTLLKKEMNALALAVAVLSFVWLAFQISRLRGADDREANEDFLREYRRRRSTARVG